VQTFLSFHASHHKHRAAQQYIASKMDKQPEFIL